MTKIQKVMQSILVRILARIVCLYPTIFSCKLYRKVSQCMLAPEELLLILTNIKKEYSILFFGLGNDTPLWVARVHQQKGTIIFIENNDSWINLIKRRFGDIQVERVDYSTRKSDWTKYISGEFDMPELAFSKNIILKKYNLVVIDAPVGYPEDSPGRMQSISMAPLLAETHALIIVDDYDRHVERTLANHFLGKHGYILSHIVGKTAVFIKS